jgi:hypothetical protein
VKKSIVTLFLAIAYQDADYVEVTLHAAGRHRRGARTGADRQQWCRMLVIV